jgi:hypothetical protein
MCAGISASLMAMTGAESWPLGPELVGNVTERLAAAGVACLDECLALCRLQHATGARLAARAE